MRRSTELTKRFRSALTRTWSTVKGDTHCKISNYSWLCPWWWWRCRRRHTRRGGAGARRARAARGAGAWRALAGAVRAALRERRPLEILGGRAGSGRCNKQTAAIRGAVTQRRQPELNADTVCCRPSWGFLPFSLAGRAPLSVQRSTTRAHALLLHPAPPRTSTEHTQGAPHFTWRRHVSIWFISCRLSKIVNFVWIVNISTCKQRIKAVADEGLASHDAFDARDVCEPTFTRIH